MIAYKAVIYKNSLFRPWTPPGRGSGLSYEIGASASQPKTCGPMACFKRVTDACTFITRFGHPGHVYHTRFGHPDRVRYTWPELILRVEVIERSPESRLWVGNEVSDLEIPEGTIFVSKLRVLSVVEPRFTRFTFRDQYLAYQRDYATCQKEVKP